MRILKPVLVVVLLAFCMTELSANIVITTCKRFKFKTIVAGTTNAANGTPVKIITPNGMVDIAPAGTKVRLGTFTAAWPNIVSTVPLPGTKLTIKIAGCPDATCKVKGGGLAACTEEEIATNSIVTVSTCTLTTGVLVDAVTDVTVSVSTCIEISLMPYTTDTIITCVQVMVSTTCHVTASTCFSQQVCSFSVTSATTATEPSDTTSGPIILPPDDESHPLRTTGWQDPAVDRIRAQTYPNPAQSEVLLEYSVPDESFVSITMYNHLGQEIRSVLNERRARGLYKLKISVGDLQPGAYYYRLRVGSEQRSDRLIVLE